MIATACVRTDEAPRYLRALCAHASREAEATWNTVRGDIDFGFAFCALRADRHHLVLLVDADGAPDLDRAAMDLAERLERLAAREGIVVRWTVASGARSERRLPPGTDRRSSQPPA